MNAQSITDIMLAFLKPEFELPDAELLIGPRMEGGDPDNVRLEPRRSNVERANAGILTGENGERYLAYLYIAFIEPVEIDMDFLIRRFGTPTAVPRLKPDQPIPFAFDVPGAPGAPYRGELLVGIEHDVSRPRMHFVRFARYPV